MLWYLLYPFRGTSDPPKLPSEHPIRRAFYRHGTITARHWLLTMLVSVTIGVILTYPVVFLSDFPTAGLTGLPHHVWTSAKEFEGHPAVQPDLEMRQIWVHGSYMKALNKTVFQEAFSLQDAIFKDTSSIKLENESPEQPNKVNWGFHSPLMYWDNEHQKLDEDQNLLATINQRTKHSSFLNFTLKPLSVFAGKTFSDSKLTAADAIVISLFNRFGDPMGEKWHDNIVNLATDPSKPWTLYQASQPLGEGQMYEYRFQPLSIRQHFALFTAYGIMAIYVALSLRRLKAFRSRFGLVVTAVTQMTTSVLASFTICGLLKINLAQIPREAYPFVVLVIGLENIFRLINAVLAYPPEMQTVHRIANGMGDIGHASLASAAQNLAILWLLSRVVSPGVSAFCAFAAVALLFDYFFLITFFVAVLNVDIRRFELQDSITRSNKLGQRRKASPERRSWIDALLHGRVPFSTRMAGSAVTTTFVMALNWHFSDHNHPSSPFKLFGGASQAQRLPIAEFDGTSPPPMNQTRSPATWLRMQDYENAVQFMNVVNPDAYGFVAKIFDPVVVVLAGSDRSGVPLEKRTWLSAVRRLAIEHFYPFALAVVFVVAFVTVLMNFLLWNANAEQAELENGSPEDPPLSADAVPTNHKLDIVRLAGSASGGLVSVALDRSVNCTAYHTGATAYKVRGINKEHAIHISWPVHAATMTRNGEFFALLCEGRRVVLYSCLDGHFLHDFTIETEENLPLIFEFTSDSIKGEDSPTLIIVTVDGLLIEHGVGPNSSSSHRISAPEINAAVLVKSKSSAIGVLALAADGTLCSGKKKAGLWQFSEPVSLQPSRKIDAPASLLALAELGTACICTTDRITFFQLASLSGGFDLECTNMKPSSVRVFHSRPKTCAGCTSAAVSSISIVYTDVQSQDCIMRTYAPSSEHAALLCLSSSKKDCAGLQTARMSEYKLSQPGAWEPTSAHAVVGVRRRVPSSPVLPSNPAAGQASLRNRKSRSPSQGFEDEGDEWEAYAFTSSGDIHTVVPSAVQNPDSSAEPQLFATRPGPACMLGPYTAAFTIGNVIYVVKVGGERTEKDSERASDGATTAAPSRRRLTARKA